MAITFPYGFTVTSTEPVDSRLVMTPAQMKSAGVRMPDYYLTVCSSGADAGKIFIFDKSMEPDDTYGRFRLIRYSDLEGMPDIPTQLSQLGDDSDHRLVTDEWIAAWNAKLTEADVAQVALTGSYNDLSDTPGIPTKLSELADDATHRLVTDAEKEAWNTGTPNKIETVKVDGVPLIPDDQKAVNVDLSKKVDKVEGKQLSTEDYTSAEKVKLANVADNAQVNVIERVKVNGLQLTPDAQKAVDVTVPTKESDLVADRGYITADVDNLTNYYTKAVIDEKLSGSMQYKTASAKADGTPNVANPEERTIYLVPSRSSKTRNAKDEYLWVDNEWELIGSTTMKLAITQDANGITINEDVLQDATTLQDGLMTKEAFSKLEGVEEGAQANVNADWDAVSGDAQILNKPTIPSTLAELTSDETHRTVTDEQIEAWSAHEENVQADWGEMSPSADSYIRNKPTIPSTLAELGEDEEHRVITDAERDKWDAAEINVLESVSVDGTPLEITDKGVDIPLTSTVQNMLAQYDPKIQSIGVWDESTEYQKDSTVLRDSKLYVSIADNNIGNDPAEGEDYWLDLASGGSGKTTNVKAYTKQFGNGTDTVYEIYHMLDTLDFLYTIRTSEMESIDDTHRGYRYVQADVYAASRNLAVVKLTEPPGVNALYINILKAQSISPEEGGVEVIHIDTASTQWNVPNTTGYPVFVQTYTWDETNGYYDEMDADVIQSPTTDFTPVTINFDTPKDGMVIMAPSESQHTFQDSDTWIINHGTNQLYAVQVYDAEEGMMLPDISQANGTITVSFEQPRSGWVVLTKPSLTVHFDNRESGRVTHDLGRYVGMQVYADGAAGQAFLDCHNIDENTCEADFNGSFSGYLLII